MNDTAALNGPKKRRIKGACDVCKQKKVKCDSGRMPNNRCTNCIQSELDCTHFRAIENFRPAKGYVEILEKRINKLERLLRKFAPNIDLDQLSDSDVDFEPIPGPNSGTSSSRVNPTSLPHISDHSHTPEIVPIAQAEHLTVFDDAYSSDTLTHTLGKMALNPQQHTFYGEASGASFVKKAFNLRQEFTPGTEDLKPLRLVTRRPEFWITPSWELINDADVRPPCTFPDDDLISELVNIYFTHLNPYIPLLHRPIFEGGIKDGLHLRDYMFGATLLLVCALGAQYSEDPRVYMDGSTSPHSRGWKWFNQVQLLRKSLKKRASLYELQLYALSVIFCRSSSSGSQSCWTMVGWGLRLAQEVGAHRRKAATKPWTVQDELWKRAFWVLVFLDRIISTVLGRPFAVHDDDFDLDLPLECDDEFWEPSAHGVAFEQPPGRPSTITYFNCFLKLQQILGSAMHTIYSIGGPSGSLKAFPDQRAIAELDSSLNEWIDSVPDHLRWNPHHPNLLFFNQSATLYSNYYHLQMFIHRPFISSPRKPSNFSFPSLAICTNAARLCSHVIHAQGNRNYFRLPYMQGAAFISAIVLLLNIWSGRRSGISVNVRKDIEAVQYCMEHLKECETRRYSSGRHWDILYEFASAGDLPLQTTITPAIEHQRDNVDANVVSSGSTGNLAMSNIPQMLALPTHSNELGRMPIYQHFHGDSESMLDPELFADAMSMQPPFQPLVDSSIPGPSAQDAVFLSGRETLAGSAPPVTSTTQDVIQYPNSFDQTSYSQILANFDFSAMNTNERPRVDELHSASNPGCPQSYEPSPMDTDAMSIWENTPAGLDTEDWWTYIANMDSVSQNPTNNDYPPGTGWQS